MGSSDTDASSPSPEAGDRTPGRALPKGLLGWAGCALLAALAYRPLLWAQPERALPEEIERWFFVPSSSLTPVVMSMAAWLLYRRLPWLRAVPDAPGATLPGLSLLAAGVAVHAWATYTGAHDLLVPSLMAVCAGAAWLWGGRRALRAVALPLAFLVFAMPLPAPLLNEVIYALQLGTTELAGALLYLMGVPHTVSGERILRPEDTFSVIESCSGLRSIETLVLVAILMMDLFRRPPAHAWIVVVSAPVVAFLMNGLRAVMLILNPHSEVAAIHNLQGVLILLGGMVLLFVLDGLLEWTGVGGRTERPAPAPAGPAGRGAPVTALALGLAALLSLLLPRWEPPEEAPIQARQRVIDTFGPFSVKDMETDPLFLGSAGFRERFTVRVERSGEPPVALFLGVGYRPSRLRSPLSPKVALPGSGWIVEEEEWLELGDGRAVRSLLLRSGSNRVLTFHWTEGAGSWVGEVLRAFLALDRSPFHARDEVLSVRLTTPVLSPVPEGKSQATEELLTFSERLRPLLDGLAEDLRKRFSGFS